MANFELVEGNLLEDKAEALVNTVNTVGVMGKGIALQFKKVFPANFKAYAKACKRGEVKIGKMFVFDNSQSDELIGPRWIVNFPTKEHWRNPSRVADIDMGLDDLRRVIVELGISSVAIPPLGCGNGGLNWSTVRPLIERKLSRLETVVHLYEPGMVPAAADMSNRTKRPELTLGKAAFIYLLKRYSDAALEASLIEVQKLMYFLQVAGEPLNLNYQKHLYGPYADNMRLSLVAMENHFIQGFGDGSAKVHDAEPISILPGAEKEAFRIIGNSGATERIEKVLELVNGYESAYGLELLASVHWVAKNQQIVDNLPAIIEEIQNWSPRKKNMFTSEHIELAWSHLQEEGWLEPTRL